MGNQSIVIKNGAWKKKCKLDGCRILIFNTVVYPPLYRIKIKGVEKTFWFNTGNHYISAGGFTSDTSAMGDLIKKKKRELGI